jgi:beta-galactosidase
MFSAFAHAVADGLYHSTDAESDRDHGNLMSEVTRRHLIRSGLALSTAAALGNSAIAWAGALLSTDARLPSATALTALPPRQQLLLDFDWKFTLGSNADALRDLGFGKRQDDFAKTGTFAFATDKFDDSRWRSVQLPHDWAVELPFVHDEALQSHGYKPLGRKYPESSVGWYRRTVEIPSTDAGRRVFLDFDGAFRSALIFVNGCFIGRNDNGYAPFRFDLTDFLSYGAKNVVVVRVDASFGDGWFYEGAGIYRHVWLTKTDSIHLEQWESYVRAEVRADTSVLSFGSIVRNQDAQSAAPRVRWQVLDTDGKTVAVAEAPPQSIAPGGSATYTASATLAAAKLWSPEAPHLYTAIVSVAAAGATRDAERISFGVRSIAFDADKGFLLNGKTVKIKGTCNHQDHAGVGAALPDRLQWYRLAVLRDMGSNAVRTSHNMPTPEWVEACNRLGMMMLCETRQMSSNAEGLAQLEVMIKRYRNSPAIILWSMGNEEGGLQGTPLGEHIAAAMIRRAHEIDPTRLCTAAVNGSYGTGISAVLDVEGINYNLGSVDGYHRSRPKQPLIGSETASTLSTRGIYTTDALRNWDSAYDVNHTRWSELAEEWWKFYATREFLPGGFAWTGFDYRGEPTPYGWPSVSSQFGIVDTCGFPKDNYYYYKAWWGGEPVLHLFPHWNWEQRTGEIIAVWVHSNLDEVELFANGESQGTKRVQPLTHLEWQVKYRPGVIEARGRKNGVVVLTDKRETTGEPAAIRLTADRSEIDADGEDIAIVRVEVVDAAGRQIPTANNSINFNIHGDGGLLGVGNGDPNCQESDLEPKRSLFNGLAQLIVRSTKTPGLITIEAFTKDFPGPKLPVTRLTIKTRKTALRPAVA